MGNRLTAGRPRLQLRLPGAQRTRSAARDGKGARLRRQGPVARPAASTAQQEFAALRKNLAWPRFQFELRDDRIELSGRQQPGARRRHRSVSHPGRIEPANPHDGARPCVRRLGHDQGAHRHGGRHAPRSATSGARPARTWPPGDHGFGWVRTPRPHAPGRRGPDGHPGRNARLPGRRRRHGAGPRDNGRGPLCTSGGSIPTDSS